MKLGIDLDGVCYPFVDRLRHCLVQHQGFSEAALPPATTWTFFRDDWGMSGTEFKAACDRAVDAGCLFWSGLPADGCIRALKMLQLDGHTIHLVTARNFGTKSIAATEAWLNGTGLPYDTLTFSENKTLLPVDIFLDDHTENYDAIKAAGGYPVLFTQAWNANHVAARVSSWDEFRMLVRNLDGWMPRHDTLEVIPC